MEIHRLGIKFFAADPASIRLEDFIPLFHGWIQRQAVPDHLLIDVHDYSHIQGGPGILLVAHEANFSLDMSGGRPGLLYYRKTPAALPLTLQHALGACRLLEKDARVQFKMDEMLLVANDRLEAPNDDATFAQFKPMLAAAIQEVFPGTFSLTRVSTDPKERLSVLAQKGE
jgi:hypothetical protein